jgi:hypothetical protein
MYYCFCGGIPFTEHAFLQDEMPFFGFLPGFLLFLPVFLGGVRVPNKSKKSVKMY